MLMVIRRIIAQLIDLLVGLMVLVATFTMILPFLSTYISNSVVLAVLGLFLIIAIITLIQYPFMMNQQTIGKAFMGLKIISTDKIRKDVSVSVIVQREVLCKLFSCYFICIPVLVGRAGGHEEATHTAVVDNK